MELYSEVSYWLLLAKTWLILGLILIIIDIFLGSFFILPIGVAAFIIAGMIFCQDQLWFGDFIFFETWRDVLIYFSIISLVSIGVIKLVFQKKYKNESDINEY
ncbi:MAG TPA: hypothetical protein EYO02_00535 [Rhodospirillales bacterium]|jgi:membrane protein implicated in regulation of membrane protease activity|nr:hypothetical protein [Rhodospirillales bacterium]HIC59670.1 hypothetical protein [Rhodospirillales bacterium]HIN75612.1 hypothetical protein [Rhodospirillales bacterium]|tara:strand:- start:205 stop:513 length:309 start_codon:yes stop_codon:yes gene_type:complete